MVEDDDRVGDVDIGWSLARPNREVDGIFRLSLLKEVDGQLRAGEPEKERHRQTRNNSCLDF